MDESARKVLLNELLRLLEGERLSEALGLVRQVAVQLIAGTPLPAEASAPFGGALLKLAAGVEHLIAAVQTLWELRDVERKKLAFLLAENEALRAKLYLQVRAETKDHTPEQVRETPAPVQH